MALRLSDTEIWNKDWYLELNLKQKLLVKFLFDSCDCAGFYHISWKKLQFFFGEEIKKEDFEAIKQVKFIKEDLIFIEDFVLFQCRIKSLNDLNPKNNAHKGVIKRLNEFSPSLAPSQPLDSPLLGDIRSKKLEVGSIDNQSSNILEEERKENITKEKKEEKTNVKPIDYEMRKRLEDLLREQNKLREQECIESG